LRVDLRRWRRWNRACRSCTCFVARPRTMNTAGFAQGRRHSLVIDDNLVRAHRARGLSPEHPFIRAPRKIQTRFSRRARRSIRIMNEPRNCRRRHEALRRADRQAISTIRVCGRPDADRFDPHGLGEAKQRARRRPLCGLPVRRWACFSALFRPFSVAHLLAALPSKSADRGFGPHQRAGRRGRTLFQDIVTGLAGAVARGERATMPHVIGGRYGLSSKEFTPAMAKAAFDD